MTFGILALQGAFAEHAAAFQELEVTTFEIRNLRDLLKPMDAIVLPGGESTVQGKLLRELGMFEPLKRKIEDGLPVFGTCAGLLLLAKKMENDDKFPAHLGAMDITARRNAYGRQLGSFRTVAEFKGLGKIPMTFIRAPYIESVEGDAEVLSVVDGKIVAARQKNMLVCAFHPELDSDRAVQRYFIELVKSANVKEGLAS